MIVPVFKKAGITSHDAVDQVRAATGETRVGHAGTLDPFAEGVLLVGIGRESTKKLGTLSRDTEKEYEAVLELGVETDTGDPEGVLERITSEERVRALSLQEIERAAASFRGEILQRPPAYSALKIKGVPAYKLAREGKSVTLKLRAVFVRSLEILSWSPPFLKIRVVCGSGTYIRSLARDLGRKLGAGAHLVSLLRTRVGPWSIEAAVLPEETGKLLVTPRVRHRPSQDPPLPL